MAATPNTGKTHPRYGRMYVGGYDLSGDMRSVSAIGVQMGEADATGWSDGSKQYLAGFGTIMLDGFTALFNNTPTAIGPVNAGSHVVLGGMGSQYVSWVQGIRAAPEIGSPTFSAAFEQGGYTSNAAIADVLTIEAAFFNSGVLPSSLYVWGTALAVGAEISSTTNYQSVDNGALSSNGYIAFLHLLQTSTAMASNNWSFKIEHGTNDSTWATLGTFSGNGSSITAVRMEGTGTVNRYTRFVGTRTAGVARPVCTLIRL